MPDYSTQQFNAAAAAAANAASNLDSATKTAITSFAGAAATAQPAFLGQAAPLPVLYTMNGQDVTSAINDYLESSESYGGRTDQGIALLLPPGRFILSNTILVPGNRAVNIMGSGKHATTLTFNGTGDLGSNHFAIDVQTPTAAASLYMQDLTLEGPNQISGTPYNSSPSQTNTVGSSPASMDGVNACVDFTATRCLISGFHSGIVIASRGQKLYQCDFGNNFYGAYFTSAANGGGQSFVECTFDTNRMAGIACSNSAILTGATWYRCHSGSAPYAFFRENSGSAGADWMVNCLLNALTLESIGNANFWDDGFNAAIRNNVLISISGYGAYDPSGSFTLTGRPHMGALPTGPAVYTGSFHDNFSVNAISYDNMVAQAIYGNRFEVCNPSATSTPLVTASAYKNSLNYGTMRSAMLNASTATNFTAGSVVERTNTAYGCQIFQGSNPVVGVTLAPSCSWSTPTFNYSPPNQVIYVAQSGQVSVQCDGSVTSVGQLVKAAAGGVVSGASSLTDGQVIGITDSSPASGMVTITLRLGI